MGVTSCSLSSSDLHVRGELTRAIAELGYAPSNYELAARLGVEVEDLEQSLQRLHESHSLQLHPHCCAVWAVHPFALSPGSCWVEIGARGWWANCLYCAMGIAAAMEADADISTRLGGEREPLVVHLRNGDILEEDLLFHVATPVRNWWDNVIHSCATFQPFRREADVHDWCNRHAMPIGAIIPLPKMWAFARDWYGDYLRKPWRKRSRDETVALFAKHGFKGDFWRVP